jgi:hypothetical protein
MLTAALAACSSSAASSSASGSSSSGSSSAAATSPAAGTSSGGAGPTPSGSAKAATAGKVIPGLITFKGTFQLRGASHRHSSFRAFPGITSPASSCRRIAAQGTPGAKGAKPQFKIPAPPAGSNVYFAAEVSPYHGPGTYGKASILAAGASISVGADSYNPLVASGTASVTFHANGSGTFTFTNAAATTPAKPTLSGSVSWTCSG